MMMYSSSPPNNFAIQLLLAAFTMTALLSPQQYYCNADWIDPDTPDDVKSTQSFTVVPGIMPPSKKKKKKKKHARRHTPAPTGSSPKPSMSPTTQPSAYPTSTPDTHQLVFSEEFNVPERTFQDGKDPRWTALEKNDYTNEALHYYSADNAATNEQGELVITTEATDTDIIGEDKDDPKKKVRKTKHFKSAMLQTWNKFCFTGGIIEAQVQLPGKSEIGGLWPAFWLLGNLARHTYVGSSAHIWPWSSNVCTEKSFNAQHASACSEVAHYGFHKGIGRGSPEVDIFEVQPGKIKANTGVYLESSVGQPFMSASFQVAPGRVMRPGPGYWPGPGQWYDGLTGGQNTSLNINFYGNYNHFKDDPNPEKSDYWSDAVSYNRQLTETHFNSSHIYRLEWDVPTEDKDGYLHWFLDGKLVFAINGTGIKQGGSGGEVSTEPMYILLNTAVSSQWGFPLPCPGSCPCKDFDCNSNEYAKRCGFNDGFCDMMTKEKKTAPQYKIDWVRVYQDPTKEEQKVGCSTPERPSRQYIQGHEKLYKTPQDEHPLKTLQVGQGTCNPLATDDSSQSCGGEERGQCTKGSKVCECKKGWVGPHCLASEGYDEIDWDPMDKLSDVGFSPPKFVFNGLIIGLSIVVLIMLVAAKWRRQLLEGWTPIPEVEVKRFL